jgi:DNA-binding MarR family transcriptional regulator
MTPRRPSSFRDPSAGGDTIVEDSISRVIAGWHGTRPDLDVEPIAVTARVARLQALLSPKLESVFGRFGLRGADFAVLATIARLTGQDVAQRRLAHELGVSAGTISIRVDRLVSRGIVRRDADPADGRSALVTLTERGRELFEACAPVHLANARELLSGLSDEERDRLGLLLGKLLSSVEDPGPDDRLALELGLVVEPAPVALERRRAVGLPPLSGVLVRHIDPQGLAAGSGIRPGDLLRSADGQPLRTHHDLQVAVRHTESGTVALELVRGVDPIRLRLRLAAEVMSA